MIIITTWRQRVIRPKNTVKEENMEKLRICHVISEYNKLAQKSINAGATSSEQRSIGRFAENMEYQWAQARRINWEQKL